MPQLSFPADCNLNTLIRIHFDFTIAYIFSLHLIEDSVENEEEKGLMGLLDESKGY